jgi:hypothetical protein
LYTSTKVTLPQTWSKTQKSKLITVVGEANYNYLQGRGLEWKKTVVSVVGHGLEANETAKVFCSFLKF